MSFQINETIEASYNHMYDIIRDLNAYIASVIRHNKHVLDDSEMGLLLEIDKINSDLDILVYRHETELDFHKKIELMHSILELAAKMLSKAVEFGRKTGMYGVTMEIAGYAKDIVDDIVYTTIDP